ncbi:hypothetical protein [Vibrio phage vB_VpM-pA2SJ1]|uniref:Uncharacterized protein n=1 Tax=Vibrio phage vB_VpM-pA2SJ1 TaxID=3095964 RepID=A0AAX4J592_9CAUD
MKKNVFTDGNGSNLIMVEGMGAYAPLHELDEAKREIEYLLTMQADAVSILEELDKVPSFRERLKGLDRPTDFAIEQAKGDELSRFHNINKRAKEFLSMLEHGLGPEDMKGGNREDVE